jgi:hypothetical protein
MNSNPKLSYAIAAILSSGAGSLAYAATPADADSDGPDPGDHRHGAAPLGEHAERAGHDPGADFGNPGAIERADVR